MKHGFEKTCSQKPLINNEKNNCFGQVNLFFRFPTRNGKVLFESHNYHTMEKKLLVKDLNKPEIHKIF